METMEALTGRRSVRLFTTQPVPRELLEKAVEAAHCAPTARNIQPWEFVAVTRPELLKLLGETTDHGRFIAQAPACVAVLSHETKYYLEDGAAAVTNLLTALHALGLGACWVAGDKKPYAEAILKILGALPTMKLIALVPCGYPDDPSPRPLKCPWQDVLHWEEYRRDLKNPGKACGRDFSSN